MQHSQNKKKTATKGRYKHCLERKHFPQGSYNDDVDDSIHDLDFITLQSYDIDFQALNHVFLEQTDLAIMCY